MKTRVISLILRRAAIVLLGTTTVCFAPAIGNAQNQGFSDFSSTQLNRIRVRAIGNEYTVDRIINRTMNQSNLRVNIDGVNVAATGQGSRTGLGVSPTRRSAASFNSFGGLTSSSKPFSSASRRPTISPYLNIFRDDLSDDIDNYNTLVRPQIQQQQVNRSLQLQTQTIDRQMQAMAARPAFNPQGSQTQSPTGHPTGFMYYSHFYPSAGVQQRRR